ncbi:peroxisomal docking protein Pex14 [Schizosaccharomyces pombe]|uniref:Peroxisomal membrane protein pex14 n=1 Tax=Schizosaccharomyces pombe (strain 972 / ATCC 24843) TaxID=284812 RepID=PEX14_SCHPO|nr:protein Pex14 [Schizosaccharomyces pombe]O60065.1 RecName: Full=Peroxisomal membrane protein pex14; AltName: Full=Peroxin-14 [Schizosaccharomyces pombe 972h-]CAA18656.1 peroxisomal docking protein Pex14 [Schizosaccharomyces pombe]|eukprot:NP_596552.1 protein Pex14 [Schizosaccharomyces pombe]
MREDLLRNSVEFLREKTVLDAPDVKKIEFLKSKGLTAEEIQEAFKLAKNPLFPSYPRFENTSNFVSRDWRDWFIMGVISTGFAWSAYSLVKKYIAPMFRAPSQNAYEADKNALDAKFLEAHKILENLDEQTRKLSERTEKQQDELDIALDDLEETLNTLKRTSENRDREIARISQDVYTMSTITLPQSLEQIKKSQEEALQNLSREISSLRCLQTDSKKDDTFATTSNSSIPVLENPLDTSEGFQTKKVGTASLPDWQISMHNEASKNIDFNDIDPAESYVAEDAY